MFELFSIDNFIIHVIQLKQIFQISYTGKEIIQPVLAIQIGEKHCAFAITENSSGELKALNYYTAEQMDEAALSSILSSNIELHQSFYRVLIGYQYPQALLIPSPHFDHENSSSVLKAMLGTSSSATIISESLPQWQLHLVYAVPAKIYQLLNLKFASAKYWHQHGLAIKNSGLTGTRAYVEFRQADFSVVLLNENRLLFAGSFQYSTPADVVYVLLKLTHSYNLSQQENQLFLSGLIDKNSALYSEIYQYFLHVKFRDAGWQTQYPAHYFTTVNDLAQCE
jgi:hypothetical protein